MCGIVAYISKVDNPDSIDLGIEALRRLEYRGYDSAGVAFWDPVARCMVSAKAVGRISQLERRIASWPRRPANPILLHTRWATHGAVSEENAHPHCDCHGNIWLVHNGIIENYGALKRQLEKEGHVFASETDTEVVAHLIEKYFRGDLSEAVREALSHVQGTYGLAVICRDDPGKIVAARLSSPLLIGLGKNEYIVASDPNAVVAHAKKAVYLDDGEIATITRDRFSITREKKPEDIDLTAQDQGKGGYPHYMLKEIMEQPDSLDNALKGRLLPEEGKARLGGLDSIQAKLRDIDKVHIVACGSAHHAAVVGEYMFEEYAGVMAKADAASEFRYRKPLLDRRSAVLAISQSGETADTLAAINEAKARGNLVLGITNAVGSTQARATDAGVYTRTGPEIAVVATKTFTAQLTVLALFALFLGRQRQLSATTGQRIAKELTRIPALVRRTLDSDAQVRELAKKYGSFNNFLYMGRKYSYAIACEGAHKMKETAYVHAEGLRGGEPKHCELALVSEDFPSVCIMPSDSVYEKMVSNVQEIKARNGPVIAIATEGNNEVKNLADDVVYIPPTLEFLSPILSVIPLQLFAYHTAVLRGRDIDKPRNLAKSVTVE